MTSRDERLTRDLAQQLAEAKATIAALLAGQIDAVVDARTGTPVLLANALNALRESEARFREQAALLDIAHDAIYVRNLDGQITYWNKGAERAYGWTADQAVGRRAVELLSREPSEYQAAEAALLLDGAWQGEMPRRTSAGREITMAVRWTLVRDAEGHPKSILAINTDITERKRAETELRTAKEAAEAANQAKDEFLANMSHEIRTPMNGVIGMTDLMLDSELTSEQRENLGIIKSSGEALMAVINDVLDFSKIEAGKLALDPIDFTSRDSIGDAAGAVALRAHQKGLELIVDIDAAVPLTLRGDPGRLRQILLNLLGNAIKFTDQGEVVLRVTSAVTTPGDAVLSFSISDTGVGIPRDRQESIFEAFTQVDGSTTRKYGGTGLGLTISSKLVDLMGGRISVESEAGRGSTFFFTARFDVGDAGATIAAIPHIDLRDVAVLIVDDNATNRHLVEGMLLGWHMAPALAANVSDALVVLRAARQSGRPFTLVLADCQMPDADGFALAEAMKEDPALAATTVVMLTSGGQPGDAARCRELNIAAYLGKPIKRSDLRDAILLALGAPSTETHRQPLVTRHSLREARLTSRILLVEDNPVNQMVVRRLLERRGHTVVVATNGREALTLLEESKWTGFGCVLMDVQMPEMDGFECTAIIRSKEPVTRVHLPIVAMTAHAMGGDEARCLAAGMDAYLSKPFEPNAFLDVVDRQLLVSAAGGEPGPTIPLP
jgi:PAS domain S-box-containing protein